MKKSIVFILTVLYLITGLAMAQTLPGNSPGSGDSSNARELVKPVGNKASKSIQPSIAPEFTLPFAMFEPPKRFLWGDIDDDGLKDLFVLDFRGNILFRNLGNGGFEDVTATAFPDGAGRGVTGFWGDYDGDALVDLFLFHGEGFTLFKNEGNLRFSDVTEALGMDKGLPVSNAQLDDFDGDGFDDLILETPEGDRIFRNQEGREFGEVDLPEPDRGRGGGTTTGWPPKNMDKETGPMTGPSSPGGLPLGPEGVISFDNRYVNDNSPGSVGIDIPEVEGGDDKTTPNDIVDGTIAGEDLGVPFELEDDLKDSVFNCINTYTLKGGIAIRGESTGPSGRGVQGVGDYGVYGESPDHTGVYGRSNASSGASNGVYGFSSSTEGKGVYGYASATTGETCGVMGVSFSPDGFGVLGEGLIYGIYGRATATSSWNWGIHGETDSTKGHGVAGYATSDTGNTFGVMGRSNSDEGKGVYGYAAGSTGENYGVLGQTNSPDGYGVFGEAKATTGYATGVHGITSAYNGRGVYGESKTTTGTSYGVYGVNNSNTGAGVFGGSPKYGVKGSATSPGGMGVYATCFLSDGYGVKAQGAKYGVYGSAGSTGETYGVFGSTNSDGGFGVRGEAPVFAVYGKATRTTSVSWGVYGESVAPNGFGVYGVAPKYGVYGFATDPGGYGGYFTGRTSVGVLEIRGGSDLSERFDIRGAEENAAPVPGMVVCIDPKHPGALLMSTKAYDRTVAGIISGAGGIKTGMLMGQEGSEADGKSPVALTGRVYCQADASGGPIEPGDLLTTSDTPGHAMKVIDHARAQGAILGKAMTSLKKGKGLVLVLVTLQ